MAGLAFGLLLVDLFDSSEACVYFASDAFSLSRRQCPVLLVVPIGVNDDLCGI